MRSNRHDSPQLQTSLSAMADPTAVSLRCVWAGQHSAVSALRAERTDSRLWGPKIFKTSLFEKNTKHWTRALHKSCSKTLPLIILKPHNYYLTSPALAVTGSGSSEEFPGRRRKPDARSSPWQLQVTEGRHGVFCGVQAICAIWPHTRVQLPHVVENMRCENCILCRQEINVVCLKMKMLCIDSLSSRAALGRLQFFLIAVTPSHSKGFIIGC